MKIIENDINGIFDKQLHFLDLYPELIYKGNNILNGYVVYQTSESNTLHMYNPNESLLNACIEYKEEAKNVYEKYKTEHEKVE